MLIDASVALKLFLEEDDSSAAQILLEQETLQAPELIIAEVANGLWKAQRRGVLSAAVYAANIAKLTEIFDDLFALSPLANRAAEISGELDHPVYDCFYLACAEREAQPLITADQRLLRVVSGTRWNALCLPLRSP